mmetsp:Transcript_20083/g.43743  ORF Transcript_20083/g.43743 Transcript_20083/m.43743 type:complete len:301 (-) Transcript_20083:399-1301(-)
MASPASSVFAAGRGIQPSKLAMTMNKERGLPCLARGWRTPDPSPTRDVGSLPSCKPGSWWAVIKEDPDSDEDATTVVGNFSLPPHASSVKRRGRSPVRQSDMMPEDSNTTAFVASRTPSPSPSSFSSQDNYRAWVPLRCKVSSSFSTLYAESECSSGFSPRNSLTLADSRMSALPLDRPVPPAVKPVAGWNGPAVPPPPPAAPVLRQVLGMPDDCPSVGSMNHPHSCADFCKYFKKPKGCKDGDACVRCHICSGKKPKPAPQVVTTGHRSRHQRRKQQQQQQQQLRLQQEQQQQLQQQPQ